jgi:pimeloyl-ACP methyl ester carboxylesterase
MNDLRSRASGLAGFTSMYADLGDLTIHAVTGGDGPAVVLLHGFAQTWRAWRAIMPALAEHYRVIVPDLRGIGGSAVTFDGFDKRTMAGDVAALLDALDIPSASVVGHDIGGMVAYAFAKSYPGRISKLGIAAVLLPEQAWYQLPLLDPRSPWWFRFHAIPLVPERLISASLSFYLDWFFDFHDPGENYDASGVTAADREAYVQAYSAPGALSAALGWFRAFPQDAADNDVWLQQPLDLPYLALAEPHVLAAMAAQAPRISARHQVAEIAPSGHWVTQQQPGQVADALIAFLGGSGA